MTHRPALKWNFPGKGACPNPQFGHEEKNKPSSKRSNERPTLMRIAIFPILLFAIVAHADEPAEKVSPFDFSISGPRTWSVASQSVVTNSLNRIEDKDLKELLRGTRPVVTLCRYPPNEHTGENPSIKVFISETPDTSPSDLLAMAREVEKKALPDYKIEEDVHTTTVNGIPAATMSAAFTSKYANGKSYPTLARVWAIRRGQFMYVIGASGPRNPPPELQRDFDLIMATFRFTSTSAAAADVSSFTCAPFALKLSAPRTWRVVPSPVPAEQFEARDKSLQEYFKRHKDVPIVSVIKAAAGSRGISTAVQIYAVSSDGVTPREFLSSLSTTEKDVFEDFRIVRDAYDTTLNDMKVAAIETSYTAVYPGSRRFPTLSRKWAIPRDKIIFVVVLTGPPEALEELQTDTDLILKSIRFTHE